MIGPRGRRAGVAALIAVAGFALIVAAGTSAPTTAAWTDSARFTTTAGTGIWGPVTTLGSCAIVTADAQPVPGQACSVSTVTLIEQGGLSAGELLRQYDVTFATGTPAPDLFIRFTVDFASSDVSSGSLTPNPAWTWGAASTSPGGDYSPAVGYLCASLPRLDGSAPFADQLVRVTVRDHSTPDRTCG